MGESIDGEEEEKFPSPLDKRTRIKALSFYWSVVWRKAISKAKGGRADKNRENENSPKNKREKRTSVSGGREEKEMGQSNEDAYK